MPRIAIILDDTFFDSLCADDDPLLTAIETFTQFMVWGSKKVGAEFWLPPKVYKKIEEKNSNENAKAILGGTFNSGESIIGFDQKTTDEQDIKSLIERLSVEADKVFYVSAKPIQNSISSMDNVMCLDYEEISKKMKFDHPDFARHIREKYFPDSV